MTVAETSAPGASSPRALPTYRSFEARVSRTERLCPSFLRVTFTGEELHSFGLGGADQRIKLLLAPDGGTLDPVRPAGADWYERWRALPEAARPVLRTYTVRSARPRLAEVDVDFVLHGVGPGAADAAGPASRWAAAARAGDRVLLVGPDSSGAGRAWGCEWAPPADAGTLLLAGDETAVPAVCAVLEQLPSGPRTVVLLEVPEQGDVLDVPAPAGAEVRWLPRRTASGTRPHGQLLTAAVREAVRGATAPVGARPAGLARALAEPEDVDVDGALLWEVPSAPAAAAGGLYAWLAGEAGVVKELRRHLVRDVGVPRSSVAFMGYWRAGRAHAV
ncbi:siderophore-interacting protein [Quadrisphaera sp. DSM 44207]|uniref:siderophore-interacting protein n=1 Tax=Quadrisphaera sp. DSM 44207 TaxID=1881057 RepID=UPI00088B882A|nr:siderophore-interacting protein [Quadrisphaera sp. DSM 44207]SDQ17127.1 NADPH-dependent ferric siderophore reductase, contains FAD-binding and SIP domains [Quadrisphaera sp. DSM 44207]